MKSYYFLIADLTVCLRTENDSTDIESLLPSFGVFAVERPSAPLLLTLTIDSKPHPTPERRLVRNFDTGNGNTAVYQLTDGGYEYMISNIYGDDCCLLTANEQFSDCHCALRGDWTMRSFGLNNALMLVYAFAGSHCQTMLVHASCVALGNEGYPFIAQSGTGKSTHTSLWMKHIEGTELLNDDNPNIRILDDGQPYIYGSPWSGKTPCYRNLRKHLGAITRIERAPRNSIVRLAPIEAFASLLPACSSMKWDVAIYRNLCNAVSRLIETTPVYTLYCLPDEEAARLSFGKLTGKEK